MKKIFYFAILIANFASYCQAPRGFYLSLGGNQTSLKSTDLLSDPAFGYKAGLTFSTGYHESYNYQIEFLYNQKSLNFKTVNSSYQDVSNVKYSSGSLDVGAFLNYYVLKPDEDKLFIGPQAGFVCSIGGKFVLNDDTNFDSFDSGKILPYLLDSRDFDNTSPISFGAGLGITGGYNNFKFDMRYNLGLTNLLSSAQTDNYNENNLYTGPLLNGKVNEISFSLSYLIWRRIKKK